MKRLSDEAMAAVELAFRDYCRDLEDSELSAASIGIYGDHARAPALLTSAQ
jgi:hypothetical protein